MNAYLIRTFITFPKKEKLIFILSYSYKMKFIYYDIHEKVNSLCGNICKFHQVFSCIFVSNLNRKNIFSSCREFSQNCSHDKPPWRICFFGSDTFAVKSLQSLCSKFRTDTLISRLDVCTTAAQDWNTKHNPVYEFATRENLTLIKWPIEDLEFIYRRYDVGVVVSFGYLIPENIIQSLPLGMLNVHGSLLPRWRGPAPIMRAIMNGDTETGVTIMKISPHKFDVGDIVRQYGVCIDPNETAVTLTNRLADLGARLLMECIRDLPRSIQLSLPQSNENVTYAKKITQYTAMVDWNEKTAEDVYNLHRAICHLFPLTTYWYDLPVKLLDVRVDEIEGMNPENKRNIEMLKTGPSVFPGLVEYSRRRSLIRIQCKDGKWICVSSIIVSEKKAKTASDFYNGFLSKKKYSLERKFTFKSVE